MQHFLQRMEHLCAHPQTFAERRSAHGTDHKLLESDRGITVRASVDDVHHRHRHDISVRATDVAIEGQLQIVGGGLGYGQRYAEDGVSTELRLSRCTVESEHLMIDGTLFECRHADQGRSDHIVDILHGLEHAFATIALLVSITQFKGFMLTSRGARRHAGTSNKSRF